MTISWIEYENGKITEIYIRYFGYPSNMHIDRVNRKELALLAHLLDGPRSVSQLAAGSGSSIAWTSERASRLEGMGLVRKQKTGVTVLVGLTDDRLGDDLRLLLTESAYLDLSKVLAGPGLAILPLLLPPGSTVREMEERTGLSKRTIRTMLRQWQGMGLAHLKGRPSSYVLSESWTHLRRFLVDYTSDRNLKWLRSKVPSATLIWQWRDEMLFSVGNKLEDPEFTSAGATRLEELGYDIAHAREYYVHRECDGEVKDEEALVQTLKADPENPRGERFIRQALIGNRADAKILIRHAGKYGLTTRVKRLVLHHGR
jgi:DNA-binding Lrp family transcriptional regulator